MEIVLRPGPNEIEICGIAPTADEHSVQIEGNGAATIIDMTVDLIPNRDIFEETYPEDDETSASSSDDEEDDTHGAEAARTITEELGTLDMKLQKAIEARDAATSRLQILTSYTNSTTATSTKADDVRKMLAMYRDERSTIYEQLIQSRGGIDDLQKQIRRKTRELDAAEKEDRKMEKKLAKQKVRERQMKERQKAERRKEAWRIGEERTRFWPKKVYRVILHLETSSIDTPASSGRGSADFVTVANDQVSTPALHDVGSGESPEKQPSGAAEIIASLLLSYVTREASWSPRYDLSLSSLTKSGTIVYRAEFTNTTSETWEDARVSLSTSQTSYQGLDDTVPFMRT